MSIKVIKSPDEMQMLSEDLRRRGSRIGLVPTMGFLHEGHLSLVRRSNEISNITVVSIFVNPAQFAPTEDLSRYPRDFVRDRELLYRNNTSIIFMPDAEQIYPEGFQTYVETTEITKTLEGASRPTHFRGVTTIVNMLFNIVKPHFAFFGQKDAQQAAVIQRMVKDLRIDVKLFVEPIVREEDGLAMSSRNIYLSQEERKDALVLYKSLLIARDLMNKKILSSSEIVAEMKKTINSVSTSALDYIKIVNEETFAEVETLTEGMSYYVLIACKIGTTRLIDNLKITL